MNLDTSYYICLKKTIIALKEIKSNKEPAIGVGALYIKLPQIRNLRSSDCAACELYIVYN